MGVAISLVYSTRQRYNMKVFLFLSLCAALALGMKVFLFLSLCAALAQAATTPSSLTEEQEKLVSQLEDQELAKEVEGIISGMDEEQLARLKEVLANYEEGSELVLINVLINEELKEMGMTEEEIKDLVDLSEMITKFLRRVPELEVKLELGEERLEDHVKLYLLGLPNKLGPLGFLGLHSILQDDEDIVDVKIEGFEPTKAAGSSSVTPVGDLLTRKLKAQKAAASAPKFEPAAPKPETDIVGEILERRRRAIRMQ